MAVTDAKIHPNNKSARQPIAVPIITALSQTDLKALSHVLGFKFEVVAVHVWATAVTATISVNVKIGTTSVLTGAITPVAGTEVVGTLAASRLTRRGSATDALNVEYTTNGSGAATNLRVTVWVRAYPLNGEV